MLRVNKKNDGMSLIEVIVSMLVLSIAVVAVTMSFSTVAKINSGSKQKQSVESLMENLLEYAEAGGTEYQSWFSPSGYTLVSDFTDIITKREELLEGIGQGMFTYNVRVITDRAPAEYDKDKLNDFRVIQFGGSNSNTILINASLESNDSDVPPNGVNDYDETAYEYFYTLHSGAVTEHNMIEEQEKSENPSYTMDLWTETPESSIPDFVDRELRLVVTTPIMGKMQLIAYFTYILDSSVYLPLATENVYEIPLYASELYDVASSADPNAKKLDQIYIMYSPSVTGEAAFGYGKDIRLWDEAKALKAKIFIANQAIGSTAVDTAIGIEGLENRSGATDIINLSFQDPGVSGANKDPLGGEIYCSCNVELENEGYFTNVSCHDNLLVSTGEEVRIVTTTLEILDPASNEVLKSKTITHLQ